MKQEAILGLCVLLFWGGCMALVPWALLIKHRVSSKWVVIGGSALLAWSLIGLAGWKLADHYTGAGINLAALYHAPKGLNGLSEEMKRPLILLLAGLGVSILGWSAFLVRRLSTHAVKEYGKGERIILAACSLLLLANPGWIQTAWVLLNIQRANQATGELLAEIRMAPREGHASRSMVHIYLEGVSAGFLTPQYMPHLTRLARQGTQFLGIEQAEMTGWTIAGQTSSICGYPILGAVGERAPGTAPCVGQLLASQGYEQSYLNGSNLDFTGKGTFWRQQGQQLVMGDVDIRSQEPNAPLSSWGIYDDTLLRAARKEQQRLAATGKPYALTLLTLDTHIPYSLSPECRKTFNDKTLAGAIQCTDLLVGRFVEELIAKDKDLLIVVQSDHLAPEVDAVRSVEQGERRHENLLIAWGPGLQGGMVKRQATMFDVAPTLLALLGQENRGLNLGRNLLAQEKTLSEVRGKSWMDNRLGPLLLFKRQGNAPTKADIETRTNAWKDGTATKEIENTDTLWTEKTQDTNHQ